ncbi:uncharacterized protein PGTG_17076 [Puccinia graminis f. sp. tritici CRL 75-36-700-3]|uniref:SMP domain-containing protein n=1 Tax=Puccinia graminis f. sp. tritici (strain CRL 75-36-700-3 / race SCCL) TaxID=418459 RepID=E3L2V2_PUCGT|nr:uncharacterized protein PGTG_17076 [Puccinia graminis f. sp. tritici CRL 75-36-700-3]EFP90877.1 hypothetical protein PGTG_17076 [Puccinia graminis f. sp. tritici CRL 75-36-700-3]
MPQKGSSGAGPTSSGQSGRGGGGSKGGMTMEAASRIQSAEARSNGGQVSSDGFAARAASAATHNAQS